MFTLGLPLYILMAAGALAIVVLGINKIRSCCCNEPAVDKVDLEGGAVEGEK